MAFAALDGAATIRCNNARLIKVHLVIELEIRSFRRQRFSQGNMLRIPLDTAIRIDFGHQQIDAEIRMSIKEILGVL